MNKNLQFGTDGIRGKADLFPFDTKTLHRIGQAIAQWSKAKYGKNPKLLIGHDTRLSCTRIKQDLISGLTQSELTIVDGAVLPTPAVLQLITQDPTYHFGIVISASHNPYTDNGIKLFDAKQGKLSPEDEATITNYFHAIAESQAPVEVQPPAESQPLTGTQAPSQTEAAKTYKETIKNHFQTNFLTGITIVLDCANGATYDVAPQVFTELGATAIPINVEPNGTNINKEAGSLHPENLQKAVVQAKADIGFAFDGDGDRIIAVNAQGQIKDGDDLLAILLTNPTYTSQGKLVGTIMTNHGLEKFLHKNNKELIRTKVGDKYIAAELQAKNLPLGGEASGHIIIRDYLNTGDGIFVALKILETIIETNNWEMKTFTKTPQILINVPVEQKKDLSTTPYATIIKEHQGKLIDGRMVVRYSGTENLLRVMVEDQTEINAKTIAQNLSQELQKALSC